MLIRSIVAAVLAGAATLALADNCELVIQGDDAAAFDRSELQLPSGCSEVKLTLLHSGWQPLEKMGHNWVLVAASNFAAITAATTRHSAADAYLPRDDIRVIASTKLIGGGGNTSVMIPLDKLSSGGDYRYFCSFPGHWPGMQGKLVSP